LSENYLICSLQYESEVTISHLPVDESGIAAYKGITNRMNKMDINLPHIVLDIGISDRLSKIWIPAQLKA
jgi:hypothetical protein